MRLKFDVSSPADSARFVRLAHGQLSSFGGSLAIDAIRACQGSDEGNLDRACLLGCRLLLLGRRGLRLLGSDLLLRGRFLRWSPAEGPLPALRLAHRLPGRYSE